MSAIIIDGAAMARQVLAEQKIRAEQLTRQGRQPGLAVVLVGDDAASAVYVRSKERACREAGVMTFDTRLPASTTEAELLQRVDELNGDPRVHGILVQLPLPRHIDAVRVLQRIAVDKDVDGFNWRNLGALLDGHPALAPCTPSGSMLLLERSGVPIAGRHAVVLGRSSIVGKPAPDMGKKPRLFGKLIIPALQWKILISGLALFLFTCLTSAKGAFATEWVPWFKAPFPLFTGQYFIASDPSVLKDGNSYKMAYTCINPSSDRAALCQAISSDGYVWENLFLGSSFEGSALAGSKGQWDEHLETPFLVKNGLTYFLYYSGYRDVGDPARGFPASLAVARSSDGKNFHPGLLLANLEPYPWLV